MSVGVVNVILDRVLDQQDLIDAAHGLAAETKGLLQRAARSLHAARVGSAEAKKAAFRRLFVKAALAEYRRHVQPAVKFAEKSLRDEVKAVRAVGADALKTIPALRKADVMRRAAERKGLPGGTP